MFTARIKIVQNIAYNAHFYETVHILITNCQHRHRHPLEGNGLQTSERVRQIVLYKEKHTLTSSSARNLAVVNNINFGSFLVCRNIESIHRITDFAPKSNQRITVFTVSLKSMNLLKNIHLRH